MNDGITVSGLLIFVGLLVVLAVIVAVARYALVRWGDWGDG